MHAVQSNESDESDESDLKLNHCINLLTYIFKFLHAKQC